MVLDGERLREPEDAVAVILSGDDCPLNGGTPFAKGSGEGQTVSIGTGHGSQTKRVHDSHESWPRARRDPAALG